MLSVSSNSVGSTASDRDEMEEEDLNAYDIWFTLYMIIIDVLPATYRFKKNQVLMQDLRNFAVAFGEENIKYQ